MVVRNEWKKYNEAPYSIFVDEFYCDGDLKKKKLNKNEKTYKMFCVINLGFKKQNKTKLLSCHRRKSK